MNSYRVEIYLKGERMAVGFTRDSSSALQLITDIAAEIGDGRWYFIQTLDEAQSVVVRASEIEAIKATVV